MDAMRRLLRRTAPFTAVRRPATRALGASAAVVLLLAGTAAMRPAPTGVTAVTASASPSASTTAGATTSGSFRKIISPDLLVIEPSGLSARQLARLSAAAGVRQVVSADGAAIKLNGHRVNVLGVNPEQFRSWTPLATATDQRLWTALGQGRFVTSPALAGQRKLHRGTAYQITGARQEQLAFGGSAPLGISGIDALVSSQASAQLGLVPGVLALVSAPGAGHGQADQGGAPDHGPVRHPDQPAARAAAAPGGPHGGQRPPVDLPAAVPGVRGPVLPRPVLDGAGRHRADRER